MKAKDSSERYAGKVRECCNYAARSAKNFIGNEKNYKRQPCGEDEKKLALKLKEDLAVFCDSVSEDTFVARQKAYVISNLLVFIFMILAAVAAILGYYYNELIIIVSLVFSVLALLSYCGAFGGTSKRTDGINIFATRSCSGEVKKRIVIEANLDAPFKRKISAKVEKFLKALNLISIILYIVFGVITLLITYNHLKFFASDAFIYIAFALPFFSIIPITLSRSVIISSSTPGVTNNLVGCYTACGILRYMSEMDLRLHHTELCVLLTGAKNANFAGAKMYCKMHAEADKRIDTTIISLDSIYNGDTITALTDSKKCLSFITEAAENADTTLIKSTPKYLNSSSKIFKKAGIQNITLTSLTEIPPLFYNTAEDNTDNINVKAIEAAMKTVLEAAYLKDSK